MATTYELVVADDSHDGERLHAVLLRVKERRLVKDHIWVNVGIEVLDAILAHSVLECRGAEARGVIGAVACLVVGTVAVDIHVIIAIGAFEEDGIGNITTENGIGGRLSRKGGFAAS